MAASAAGNAAAPAPAGRSSDQTGTSKRRRTTPYLAMVAAGGLAGIASKTAVAPFDRIKILNQTGASEGMVATFRAITSKEGVAGLWRGNFVNCVRIFPAKGVLYMCSDVYKEGLRKFHNIGPAAAFPFWLSVLSGSCSGITAAVSTYPLDLIRGRIAGVLAESQRGIIGTAAHVVKTEGFRGLYSGLTPTVLGAIPYEGVKFGVYDLIKSNVHRMPDSIRDLPPTYHNLVAGATAGACASSLLFPNDTVRRLMQIQGALGSLGSHKQAYNSAWHCYVHTFKTEGIKRFYRGIGVNLLRVAPNAAIQFGVYEYGKELIRERDIH